MDEVRIYRWVDRMSKHRDNFLVALTYYTSEKEMIPRNEEKLKNEEKNLTQQFRILKSDFEWLEKNIFLKEKYRPEDKYREEFTISPTGMER